MSPSKNVGAVCDAQFIDEEILIFAWFFVQWIGNLSITQQNNLQYGKQQRNGMWTTITRNDRDCNFFGDELKKAVH